MSSGLAPNPPTPIIPSRRGTGCTPFECDPESTASVCGVELLLDTREGTLLEGSAVSGRVPGSSYPFACCAKITGSPSKARCTVDGVTLVEFFLSLDFCILFADESGMGGLNMLAAGDRGTEGLGLASSIAHI